MIEGGLRSGEVRMGQGVERRQYTDFQNAASQLFTVLLDYRMSQQGSRPVICCYEKKHLEKRQLSG